MRHHLLSATIILLLVNSYGPLYEVVVVLSDQDFFDFLQYLKTNGHLNNTLLIVMGDHGSRYSEVRQTTQGKLEERLPMMSLTFPDNFKVFHCLLCSIFF